MDDSDSSLTRKRPRLYSGDRSHRSMSADELSTTPPHLTMNHSPSAPASTGHRDVNPGVNEAVSTPSQTPSKVTINVRDTGLGVSQQLPPVTDQIIDYAPQDSEQTRVELVEAPTNRDTPSPDVISVSSSSSRSPEIEVAEIEDMEDLPEETRWRTLREAADIQITVLEQFPYHAPGRHFWKSAEMVADCFENGKPGHFRFPEA